MNVLYNDIIELFNKNHTQYPLFESKLYMVFILRNIHRNIHGFPEFCK